MLCPRRARDVVGETTRPIAGGRARQGLIFITCSTCVRSASLAGCHRSVCEGLFATPPSTRGLRKRAQLPSDTRDEARHRVRAGAGDQRPAQPCY